MGKRIIRKMPVKKGTKMVRNKPTTQNKMTKSLDQTIQRTLLTAYEELHDQVERAWSKLQQDVRRGASQEVIIRDRNELALLLGECNYMEKETRRCAKK